MSPLTLVQAIAEFRRAGLPVDQDNDSLCPVCRRMFSIADHNGDVILECSEGCSRDEIADALYSLANGNPDAPPGDIATSSWDPVDLGPILSGNHPEERPNILHRTDGVGLFYAGRLHAGYGEPEACKGWFGLAAAAGCIEAGDPVLYVDYEDTATNVVARLRAMGVSDADLLMRFYYVRADEPLGDEDRYALLEIAPTFVVIDGLTEAFAIEGLDLADNQDAAVLYKRLARPFTRIGAAVLLIDHVVKDREHRGRYALGAQHKLAGVDVAYRLDVAQPFGREREGLVKVTVTKDRPGFVRQHAADRERVALMRLTSIDGVVTATLEAPADHGATFRPTVLMDRVARAVTESPGLSKRSIREAVKGKNSTVDLALDTLIAEGYIEPRRDNARIGHHPIRPFFHNEGHTNGRAPAAVPPVPPLAPAVPQPCPVDLTGRAERLALDHADLGGGQAT